MKNSIFERWGSHLVSLTAGVVPLLLHTGMNDTFDLPKLIFLYCVVLLLIALWALEGLRQNAVTIRHGPVDLPVAAFLAAGLLSTVFSIDRSLSLLGTYKIYIFGWLPLAAFAALYVLTSQLRAPSLDLRIRRAMLIAAAWVSLYGILQYTGNELFAGIPRAPGGRVWSSLGNPLYMGALCMMGAAILFAEIWNRPPKPAAWIPPALLFMLFVAVMALSLSRSAWLGLTAACSWIIWHRRREAASRRGLGLFLLAAMTVVALLPAVRQRARVLISATEGSNAARVAGWKAGFAVWKNNPVWGTGPDTFFQAFRPFRDIRYIRAAGPSMTQAHAHNDLIQLGATQGTLGAICYLWGLFVLWRCRPDPAQSSAKQGFFAALLALAVQNLFNFSAVATCVWAALAAARFAEPAESATKTLTPASRWALRGLTASTVVGLWFAWIPLRADLAYAQGSHWMNLGDFQRARTHFEQAVRLQSRVELYQTELGNALRLLGRSTPSETWRQDYFDRAWEIANDAARRHPHNPDAWNNRGVVAMWLVQLAQRDQWQEAKQSFEQAVRLDPVFVDAWANLAKWEHLRGNLEKEKEIWRKVLDIYPAHAMARQVLQQP